MDDFSAYITFLQVVAAFLQAIFALIAIPVSSYFAIRSAERGAQRGVELGDEKVRQHDKEVQEKQKRSVRLLLSQEIKRNLDDVMWVRHNIALICGQDVASYYEIRVRSAADEKERYRWFSERQLFLEQYLPEWRHQLWHSQQLSPELATRLDIAEIQQVDSIHTHLDRITNIKNIIVSYNNRRSNSHSAESFDREILPLWIEFNRTIERLLANGNPLPEADGLNINAASAQTTPLTLPAASPVSIGNGQNDPTLTSPTYGAIKQPTDVANVQQSV